MNRLEAHQLIDKIYDSWENADKSVVPEPIEPAKVERVLPEGKRVVRTKSSGDRVYLLDEVKKIRQWVTTAEVLSGLGFEMSDVGEVDDTEMLKYQMCPAIYKVPSGKT